MSRMVGRARVREGRSLGERFAEIVVYVLIIAGLVYGGRWYFVVYRNSPKVILAKYLRMVRAGDTKGQYALLSAQTKAYFGSESQYEQKWPAASDLAGRLAGWEITSAKEGPDRAEITAVVRVRPPNQELYQAESDPYEDRYVLVREADGWRIALDQCVLKSVAAAKGGVR